LDLTPEFRAAAPQASTEHQDEWLFQRGVGHFNERGHELAAEVLHRHLGTLIDGGAAVDGPRADARRDSQRR
jgi:hypothetical protein